MSNDPSLRSVDRLSELLDRFKVRARLFHNGPLCGVTRFAAEPGAGFLHVMRRGEMSVTHPVGKRIEVCEPSVIFYPRPLAHDFHNAPSEGADFTCAVIEFDNGANHPLARELPDVVVLPLSQMPSVEHTLALLFAETDRLRCGQRLLAGRLFEVLLIQLLRWLLDHPEQLGRPAGLLRGLGHPSLARALTAIHERPGEPWTLPAMAREAGMSRSAFAALFTRCVGQTPADYLARWRVAVAQQRLLEGASVKTLAAELGYGSASTLSRAFARHDGQRPQAWLRDRRQ